MKVVALVSGGKDSCFAMMRCIDYGHEIVALANLLPIDDNVDELDSYMYQTVGHQIVEAYAQCMGIPLFRRRIQGKLKTSDMRYAPTDGDEVEDLEVLLRAVKERIPSVNAVSSGAIASDYQRLRVESVCSRLGLISLAYLWKQDQAELLDTMLDRGISAILVKVAALGLDPHKHLGKDLSFMHPILSRLHVKFGSNVCGEGGEYESLTLDCPLFKKERVVVDDFEVVLHSPGSIASVGVLHPTKFHLEPKSENHSSTENGQIFWVEDHHTPLLHDPDTGNGDATHNEDRCIVSVSTQDAYETITCWHKGSFVQGVGPEMSILLDVVEARLEERALTWADVLYIHLYLRNMNDFVEVNDVYSNHIRDSNCARGVPSRCTVEAQLETLDAGNLMVEVLASKYQTKNVLHVRSISCWAPSCIGPYSQATSHGGLLFMAGQIGLDPPTMTMVLGGAAQEMQQVLRNCEAVAESFGSSFRRCSMYITVYCCSSLSSSDIAEAEDQLQSFLSSCEDDGDDGPRWKPLVLFVTVSALPKAAKVEIEPLLLLNSEVEAEDTLVSSPSSLCQYYKLPGRWCRAMVTTSSNDIDVLSIVEELSYALEDSELCWNDVVEFRVYFMTSTVNFEDLVTSFERAPCKPVLVPVHLVGQNGERIAFKLVASKLATQEHSI